MTKMKIKITSKIASKFYRLFKKEHLIIMLTLFKGGMNISTIPKMLKVMFKPDLIKNIQYNRNKKFKVYYYNDSNSINLLKVEFFEKGKNFFNPWICVKVDDSFVIQDDHVKIYQDIVSSYYNKAWDEIIKVSGRNQKIDSILG